jgi:allantoate deiminase
LSTAPNTKSIDIDTPLVEQYISQMAQFGKFGQTGVNRIAYSPEWVAAMDQYAKWCSDANLVVKRDSVGNIWGVLQGTTGRNVIASGSHIDSQTSGGRYDGSLGALSALIALRALAEQFGRPKRTLECVALCEEEGSRFPSAQFWGSRAITGRISREDPDRVLGWDGQSVASAMREVGLDPTKFLESKRDDIDAFIELHIEQGPILEQLGLPVAIVTGITGIRHYQVELLGKQDHAGAFPMDMRRDAMAGFSEVSSGVLNTAHRWGRPTVTTVGRIVCEPNFPAIVPGKISFTVDCRHPDPELCQKLYGTHEALMREVAERRQLDINWTIINDHPPCPSDLGLIDIFSKGAAIQRVPFTTMHSGAGHDCQQMGRIAKVVMIFVRSKGGRSHTPDEFSSVDDIVAGIKTLAAGLHKMAY